MADFRRLFYALALVALLAGLTVPVSAQAPAFQCTTNAGVPPIVRGEGYAELVGDLVLNCTGGTPTAAGQVVPQVNFTILLNTNITSKLLAAGVWSEALLIIDEPHSAVNPTRPILNCGNTNQGAPDNGPSGPGVCSIVSDGNPADTYNPLIASTPAGCTPVGTTNAYGCGRPNVFQARTGSQQNPGQFNAVTWSGVPLDPPGTTTTRTLRFTNIRADAVFLGVSSTFTTNFVQAQISVNGNTSLAINNPQQIVAFVQKGLITPPITSVSFLQCVGQNTAAFISGTGTSLSNSPSTPTFVFQEGFQSSWKAKNIAMITSQFGNGTLASGASYWQYTGLANSPTFNYPSDLNQNVPGAIYNTESGFMYPLGGVDPSPNPPQGVGTVPVTATTNAFNNGTGISTAGVATQGTRLAIQITNIPNGSIVLVPQVIFLSNNGTNHTGVAVLTTTDANGNGPYSPPSGALSASNFVAVQSSGLVVYEVLFADPFSIETASVPIAVAWAANLASNLPTPNVTAQAAGSFAPFYNTAAAHNPSSTLPVPRFVPGTTPQNLFTIFKCSCDVLFPYVVSAGGYDTGIAIANTSLDPGAAFGFSGVPQSGAVQFWYYGSTASGGAPPATQCTNTSSPGTCPGTTVVPQGQVLTYVLSSGSTTWGLDNRANGFIGYIIAQAQFQYCHAFAFIGALGQGPLNPGVSEGYLGLIMTNGSTLNRVAPSAEALNQ
ncbi:MAG TPA: hypothetical protein VKV74_13590 [Bryobacteraceae bacterium]|nr:hypothetical protein [Bryobacteraceae bacterium]